MARIALNSRTAPPMRSVTGRALGPQIMVCEQQPNESRFTVIGGVEGRYLNKPTGGLWTSSLKDGTSGWIEWCLGEAFGDVAATPWWKMTPDPAAVILQVETMADYRAIMETYGELYSDADPVPVFNWSRIAEDGYAGLNLTEAGAVACRWGGIEDGMCMYAWDCESTVWFSWAFESVEVYRCPES